MDIYDRYRISKYFSHIYMPVYQLLGLVPVLGVLGFVRLSVELDPLTQGCSKSSIYQSVLSDIILLWYRPSQEHLLRSCIGGFGQLCHWWPVEASKVRGMSWCF